MNRQWVREGLESFKALCERYQDEGRRTADYTDTMRAISDQMAYEIPTVREILKRLDPTLVQEVTEPLHLGGAFIITRCGLSSRDLASCATRTSGQPTSPRTHPR
jgi:hypothetical protein